MPVICFIETVLNLLPDVRCRLRTTNRTWKFTSLIPQVQPFGIHSHPYLCGVQSCSSSDINCQVRGVPICWTLPTPMEP